jgi:hypothetical protein
VSRKIAKRKRQKFLELLLENGCNVTAAAETIGVHRSSLYTIRDQDPDFAVAWQQAELLYLEGLQETVFDWAENGYTVSSQEMVVDAQGQQVGRTKRKIEKRYDMRLAVRVLERRHPNWKPSGEVAVTTPTGVLIVPGISESVEAWEKEFGATDDS